MTHYPALPLAHQTTLRWLVTTGGTPHPSDLPHLHALAADGLAHHDADDGTWRASDKGRAVWHGRHDPMPWGTYTHGLDDPFYTPPTTEESSA